MTLHRRKLLCLTAGVVAMFAMPGCGLAENYPSRPVRLIVGFAAGGPLDTGAQLIAQVLTERLTNRSLLKVTRVPVAISLPRRWRGQVRTVTRCSFVLQPTHGMRAFTRI